MSTFVQPVLPGPEPVLVSDRLLFFLRPIKDRRDVSQRACGCSIAQVPEVLLQHLELSNALVDRLEGSLFGVLAQLLFERALAEVQEGFELSLNLPIFGISLIRLPSSISWSR